MQAARQRNTAPEIAIRRRLFACGLRYRVDHRVIPSLNRRADIVFVGARVAVFVDGCFWHGCPRHGTKPRANAAWWSEKLAKNRHRDLETTRVLKRANWHVIRIWEHEDSERAVARITIALRERR